MITRHPLSRFGTHKFHLFGTVFAWSIIASLAVWFVISIKRNQAEAQRQTTVAERNVATAARQKAQGPFTSIPPK